LVLVPVKISRRALLVAGGVTVAAAGAGYLLVDSTLLPGHGALDRTLGRCDVAVPAAEVASGPMVDGEFDSTRRHRRVGYRLAYPPGSAPGDRLPVCLVLHGYGSDAKGAIEAARYDRYLAAAVAAGVPRFALAACDGGAGYWHPHVADDPLGALLDEFLPLLASKGLAVDRVAALGWSMGGYGALLCGISAPTRFAVVVATAPAIWRSYAEAHRVNPMAFDSQAEWDAYNVFARAGLLSGLQVRVDCGESDSFAPAVGALREVLPDPGAVHLAKGCHDNAFWQYAAPTQLRLIGETLNRA
jgi:S-formylglutathione hydrolase FrmB